MGRRFRGRCLLLGCEGRGQGLETEVILWVHPGTIKLDLGQDHRSQSSTRIGQSVTDSIKLNGIA